jgi:hypothetical protein
MFVGCTNLHGFRKPLPVVSSPIKGVTVESKITYKHGFIKKVKTKTKINSEGLKNTKDSITKHFWGL